LIQGGDPTPIAGALQASLLEDPPGDVIVEVEPVEPVETNPATPESADVATEDESKPAATRDPGEEPQAGAVNPEPT
jgi:segregation and condensation protein B